MTKLKETNKNLPVWTRARCCELFDLEETKTKEQFGGDEPVIFYLFRGGQALPIDVYVCKRFGEYIRRKADGKV